MTSAREGQANEFILESSPENGISAVKFGPSSNQFLIASSWDGYLRLYDIEKNQCQKSFQHDWPVLDTCFEGTSHAWTACADKGVRLYDLDTGTGHKAGLHDEPVRCVEFAAETNQVVTGSWDKTLKIWDPRRPDGPTGTHNQDNKVYALAISGNKVIVGTSYRKVNIWDLRNMASALWKRDSSLKFQTRAIEASPDKSCFVLSSIEGRVAVEYLDPSAEVQAKKYAFKCHRSKDSSTNIENIYPVNAIAFHNVHGTFATGGSDGYVTIWDAQRKKRICQLHKFPTSIASLAFSPDGSLLAIASSFQYEHTPTPEIQKLPNEIYIRNVYDHETLSK